MNQSLTGSVFINVVDNKKKKDMHFLQNMLATLLIIILFFHELFT